MWVLVRFYGENRTNYETNVKDRDKGKTHVCRTDSRIGNKDWNKLNIEFIKHKTGLFFSETDNYSLN